MSHHTSGHEARAIATAATMGALCGLPFALHLCGLPSMSAYLLLPAAWAWSQVHTWATSAGAPRYAAECDTGEIPAHQLDELRRLVASDDNPDCN